MEIKFEKNIIILLLIFTTLFGCKKWIEVDLPVDAITGKTAYADVNTAASVMSELYSEMSENYVRANFVFTPFAADEFYVAPDVIAGSPLAPIYLNAVPVANGGNTYYSTVWDFSYRKGIYTCNSLIEGVTASNGIGETNKRLLLAEAKFTRALFYFYLVNYFGDAPLVTTTDLKTNSNIARSPVSDVYGLIIQDLAFAKENLSPQYLSPDLRTITVDRVRPTKSAATALLARVYLYLGNWKMAEELASEVISNNTLFEMTSVDDVFKKDSRETIWALEPNSNSSNTNTVEGQTFIPVPGERTDIFMNEALYDAFDPSDKRRENWIGELVDNSTIPAKVSHYPAKYKVGRDLTGVPQPREEYSVILRLAEQYLIRAEARIKLLNLDGAKDDINVVRHRAGLGDTNAGTPQEFENEILRQRQLELFTEGGHRWLDLKRTGKVDEIMRVQTPIKGGIWSPFKALFPIPYSEFLYNSTLHGHQNPGYPENP